MISAISANLTNAPVRPLDVIVADDEASDNLLLTMAARDAEVEMTLTFAKDGEELLRILNERVASGNAPDVVVLDGSWFAPTQKRLSRA